MSKNVDVPVPQRKSRWLELVGPITAIVGTVTAIASLTTAVQAIKATNIQLAPIITLKGADTYPNKDAHDGPDPYLNTQVTFVNTGQTPTHNLHFQSAAWYPVKLTPTYEGNKIDDGAMETVEVTSDWLTWSPNENLQKDQPTGHRFVDSPSPHKPYNTFDYLYIVADYDDQFGFLFGRHITTTFCLKRYPPETAGATTTGWVTSPAHACLDGYKQVTAKSGSPKLDEQEDQ